MKTTNKAVTLFAKDETMSSYDFWKVLNKIRVESGGNKVEHGKFLSRVVDECDDLSHSTILRVEKSNREIETYQLNKDQMLLIGMRESKVVRKQVLNWLHELSDRVQQFEQEKINRSTAALNYNKQNSKLKSVRAAIGKETQHYHYSNEANLINRIVLGMSAKQYRLDNDFDKTVNLRDTLSTIELEAVGTLEDCNTSFITAGLDYDTRKELLTKIFNRDFTTRLIDELAKLEA